MAVELLYEQVKQLQIERDNLIEQKRSQIEELNQEQ